MATYRFDLTTRQISEVSLPIPPQVTIQATGAAYGTSSANAVSSIKAAVGTAYGTSSVSGAGAFLGIGAAVGTINGLATVTGYAVPIRTGMGTGQIWGTSSAYAVGQGLIIRDAVGVADGTSSANAAAAYDPHFSKVVLFIPGQLSDGATPQDMSAYRWGLLPDGADVVGSVSPPGVIGSMRGWHGGLLPDVSGAVVVRADGIPAALNASGRAFTLEMFCKVVNLGEGVPPYVYGHDGRGDLFQLGKLTTWEYGVFLQGLRLYFSDPYTLVVAFGAELGGLYQFVARVRHDESPAMFHIAVVVEVDGTVRIYADGTHVGGGVVGPYETVWMPPDGSVVVGARIVDVYDAESPAKLFGFGGNIAQLRLTMDVARYNGASFTVPLLPFARGGG